MLSRDSLSLNLPESVGLCYHARDASTPPHESRPLRGEGRGSRPLFPTFGLVGVRLNLLGYIDEPCPYTVCHLSVL
jgi:hypothetical protein